METNVTELLSDNLSQNESKENSNSIEADGEVKAQSESETRLRKPTDKYVEWQVEQCEHNINSAISAWRKRAVNIECTIFELRDASELKQEQSALVRVMDDVANAFNRYDKLPSSSKKVDICDKYASVENDNLELIKRLSKQICKINLENETQGSIKSSRSASSRRSESSNVSKHIEAAAEAAVLKAKLEHMGLEEQKRVEFEQKRSELEWAKTVKELGMAEAKLGAIAKAEAAESCYMMHDIAQASKIPSLTNREKVERFLQTQRSETNELANNVIQLDTTFVADIPLNNSSQIIYETRDTPTRPNVLAPEFVPNRTAHPLNSTTHSEPLPSVFSPPTYHQSADIVGIVNALSEQVSNSRLPPPEPGVFWGDPLSYPVWKSSFQTLVGRKSIPSNEKIFYLKKYLGGTAKEAVEGYFLLSNDNAFEEAMTLLEQRYGNELMIANAFRDKLELWPKIYSRDGLALRKFADFLRQCNTALQTIPSLRFLNDDRENQKMLTKLPEWLTLRWVRIVSGSRELRQTFPPFSEFVQFIVKEANIACDPMTALNTGKQNKMSETEKTDRKRYAGARTFSTATKETSHTKENRNKHQQCLMCEEDHDIDDCKRFLQKCNEARKDFVKENGLCFGCLQKGHRSKWCKQRKRCSICARRHPTSLHDDQRNDKTDRKSEVFATSSSISLLNNSDTGGKSSMIVPVWISHSDKPDREIMVYALLDTQSDTTFVLEETCDKLGVSGTNVSLCLSTMCSKEKLIDSQKINGLIVRAHDSKLRISLPPSYTRDIMPADRSHIPTPQMAEKWPHLRKIANKLMPLSNAQVGLLIGYNCSRALVPREVISYVNDEPYAQRTDLGWGIVGIVGEINRIVSNDPIGTSHRILTCEVPNNVCLPSDKGKVISFCFRTTIKEIINPLDIVRMMELDFSEQKSNEKTLSQDDRKFISKVSAGINLRKDGHYEMPLPFKETEPNLPNNKTMAIHRLMSLKRRFLSSEKYRQDYVTFMEDVINNGLAKEVTETEICNKKDKIWYIPHHGIYHPKKPDKIRVVFDCSAQFRGESLNDHLLQGPDLTNGLVGVLCRFRQEPIAFMCDIKQMFYQFKVSENHQDFLRFMWWRNGDHTSDPIEFKMNVHLFGAVSSPGCANFGLKQTASDNEAECGTAAANIIRRDFYVDDGLKSTATVQEAVQLIESSRQMCAKGGLNLHKFVSNSEAVLATIPVEDCTQGVKSTNLLDTTLSLERALGVQWCIKSDAFKFRIILKDKPLTRRGVLSTVSSVYDPLGFVAPVILIGKQILQQMCRDSADWDSPLSEDLRPLWEHWRKSLHSLETLEVKRCFKPKNFGKIISAELHHFSDASTQGYGQCSYLRLVDDSQTVHCSLVMGKARVTPLKPVTIPRLELTAAVVSVKVSAFLQGELDLNDVTEIFWTDSKVVLGYITNDTRRFHVFVANRVQRIREHTSPSQWMYVKSEDNPADDASRGLQSEAFVNHPRWITGPDFLWKPSVTQEIYPDFSIFPNDPEVKLSKVLATCTTSIAQRFDLGRFSYFSSWSRLTRAVANCFKFSIRLKGRIKLKKENERKTQLSDRSVNVGHLAQAEFAIVRLVQKEAFGDEVKILTIAKNGDHSECIKASSSLFRLDPFLDEFGVLRIGGRIKRSTFLKESNHPIILPRNNHVTELLVRHFHERVQHQGRGITINEIRSNGYWVIGCSSAVSTLIHKCVQCRKIRRPAQEQKMADLPEDRLEPAPPFTYCGVDLFGPFYVKEGRKELKRYGVIFTCMASRAIHLETANSLTTDSFINALRRFISIRGPIRQLRSDRGTNFVGAERELREALDEMNNEAIRQFCLQENCDYITWKMNVPSASHMGGVWERQIRTVRSVLSGIMTHAGTQLDDESLRTFLNEAAAIVNSRPLSVDNINDPTSLDPLTPNHILTMKSKIVLPPPGNFQSADMYCRKRWRRVQYLTNEFWRRWKKEYLQNLQIRPKWNTVRRDFKVGDVVLIVDQCLSRNHWHLARVCEAFPSADDRVRKVKLITADPSLDKNGKRTRPEVFMERPVQKLVLLLPQS